MNRKWAPWRAEYLEQLNDRVEGNACIFCIKPKEKKDKNNLILYRAADCFVIMNKYPYNTGHLLLVPYKHLDDITRASKKTLTDIMTVSQKCVKILQKIMKPDGFNIGWNLGRVAGAAIKNHIHMHVVPRWNGDTNFLPVIADVKIMSEGLVSSYNKLKREFNILK